MHFAVMVSTSLRRTSRTEHGNLPHFAVSFYSDPKYSLHQLTLIPYSQRQIAGKYLRPVVSFVEPKLMFAVDDYNN